MTMKAFHHIQTVIGKYTLPCGNVITPTAWHGSRRTAFAIATWIGLLVTLQLAIPGHALAQSITSRPMTGRLISHTLYMPQFHNEKQIWLYLPPGYGDAPHRRYPVLYMQDGQTLFDPQATEPANDAIDTALARELNQALDWYGSWQLNRRLDRLAGEFERAKIIVVGISSASGNRTAEYSPWPWYGALQPQAEKYLNCLIETVKPFIDTHYLTLPGRRHTGIGGSSLGGLVAIYGGLKYQQVFSRIAAFSPVLIPEVAGRQLTGFVLDRGKSGPMKIYVDLGDQELGFGPLQPLHDALREVGFSTDELEFRLIPGGRHRISDWGKRFPDALLWLAP